MPQAGEGAHEDSWKRTSSRRHPEARSATGTTLRMRMQARPETEASVVQVRLELQPISIESAFIDIDEDARGHVRVHDREQA